LIWLAKGQDQAIVFTPFEACRQYYAGVQLDVLAWNVDADGQSGVSLFLFTPEQIDNS